MPIDFRKPQYFKEFRFGSTLVWSVIKEIIIPTTVSGVSPLTLVNAAAKEIQSLIQYGKCTVVDNEIYCNNGKLVAIDDELPSGYKRLVGIDFNGSFWYETGEALTGEDDVTLTVDNTVSSGQNIFGSYNGTASGRKNFSLYIYGGTSSTSSYFRYGDQLRRPVLGSGKRTLTFGKSGTSGFSTNVSVDPDEFSTPSNTYIGMLPNSTSPEYTGDIIGSITVGTRLEWIPCENPDGVIGYYERVNGNFIAPSGSGTPVSLGYDTSHFTVLNVIGDAEVLTVMHDLVDRSAVVSNAYVRAGNVSESKPLGAENYGSGWYCSGYIPVTPMTDYKTVVSSYESATGAGLCFYSGTTVESCIDGITTQRQKEEVYQFTTPENCHYVRFSWKTDGVNGGSMFKISETQIASAVDLFAVEDYADTQDIIGGVVTRKCGIKVLNGTENWQEGPTASVTRFRLAIPDAVGGASRSPVLSSDFTYAPSGQPVGGAFLSTKFLYIIPDQTITTVEAFTATIAELHPIVVYPLAEEITESIVEQPLNTLKGNNIVDIVTEIDDIPLEVEYYTIG